MAIRDRVTVKTKDGTTTVIQATKAGGSVTFEQKTRENTLIVEEFGQTKDPIRSLVVPISEIVWFLQETDVPAEKAEKATRRRKAD